MGKQNSISVSQTDVVTPVKALIRKHDIALVVAGSVLAAVANFILFGLPWIVTVLEVAK